jgi:hypothetical protein
VRPAALLAQPGRPVDDTVAAGVGESYIIDVQHRWHRFLIMGVLVGPRHCRRRRAPPGRMLTLFASNLF